MMGKEGGMMSGSKGGGDDDQAIAIFSGKIYVRCYFRQARYCGRYCRRYCRSYFVRRYFIRRYVSSR